MDQNNENNNAADLSGALGDSSGGVKFKDSGWGAHKSYKGTTVPKIIQWVIKYSGGLVKNEKQANYVLLAFVALAIIISLFFIFGGGNNQKGFAPSIMAPPQDFVSPAKF